MAQDTLSDVKVIDVDTHYSEPADLWTSRATPKYRDRVPYVRQIDGRPVWVMDGDRSIGNPGFAVVRHDGSKVRNMSFMDWTPDQVHPACSKAKERLAMMDESGIYAQVLYPNVLGFGGQLRGDAARTPIDADLRLVTTQIYNDAMAELQAESNGRLLPMALLPWWDTKQAVTEAERCHGMGLKGINTNPDPHTHGMQPLDGEDWTPLWEFCSDKNMPVNFHIGGSTATMDWYGTASWPDFSPEKKLAVGSTMLFVGNARGICNLIISGLLERFPKLKFVSVESGIGWLPFILEALEYEIYESGANPDAKLTMTPMEYFRRQIYGCFWFEKQGLTDMIRRLGVDNCMFESDFPHPTCLYPRPLESAADALSGLTDAERRKVLSGNAARVYNIALN